VMVRFYCSLTGPALPILTSMRHAGRRDASARRAPQNDAVR
jgi:hypothetical protein